MRSWPPPGISAEEWEAEIARLELEQRALRYGSGEVRAPATSSPPTFERWTTRLARRLAAALAELSKLVGQ